MKEWKGQTVLIWFTKKDSILTFNTTNTGYPPKSQEENKKCWGITLESRSRRLCNPSAGTHTLSLPLLLAGRWWAARWEAHVSRNERGHRPKARRTEALSPKRHQVLPTTPRVRLASAPPPWNLEAMATGLTPWHNLTESLKGDPEPGDAARLHPDAWPQKPEKTKVAVS